MHTKVVGSMKGRAPSASWFIMMNCSTSSWFIMMNCSILNLSSFICVLQIPQGQLHIAQVPQGEEVQITQDSEASVCICEIKSIEKLATPFLFFFPETYSISISNQSWAIPHIFQPFYVVSKLHNGLKHIVMWKSAFEDGFIYMFHIHCKLTEILSGCSERL